VRVDVPVTANVLERVAARATANVLESVAAPVRVDVPLTANVLESVAAPVTVNLLPTLTSVVNTTGFVDMYIRLYTWCINKFNEDRMQFNYQIISCAVISTMDFILIILTFLKCNTFTPMKI
jgi:hypothetical protein